MKKLTITLMIATVLNVANVFAQSCDYSGTTGPLSWCLKDGTLTIGGTGAMPDYEVGGTPWYEYQESINTIIMENGVTSIGNYAFYGCYYLHSVILNNIISIGNSAFQHCYSLVSIIIPQSITSIGTRVFWGCDSLTSIDVESNNINYSSENGVLFDKEKTIIIKYPAGKTSTTYIIPNTVTTIGETAFSLCYSLSSVIIPNSTTTIEQEAFSDNGLTSVTIGDSVTTIGWGAFRFCSGLTSVTIPNSVITIGENAFRNCNGLTSITIGNNVTTIGVCAFADCSSLMSIDVESNNKNYSSENGVLFDKTKTILIQYPASKTDITYTISNSVITIGDGAFSLSSNLTSVTIGNSVTTIGRWAFNSCNSLTSLTIGNSVTTILWGAFAGCSSLTSVVIPNNVTTIEGNAFYVCSSLTSVIIGSSVTTIGEWAFIACQMLNSITIFNSEPIVINSNVFQDVNITTSTLIVPANAVSAYKNAEVWKEFKIVGGGFLVNSKSNNTEYGYTTGDGLYEANKTATITAVPFGINKFVNWTKNGVEISTVNPYSFTVTEDVELVANFEEGVGIETITNDELQITVYPNPTNGELKIENGKWKVENVEIMDVIGRIVETRLIASLQDYTTIINISHLPSGIYFLRIQMENGVVVRKVVKN